jgi:hypothetical protein
MVYGLYSIGDLQVSRRTMKSEDIRRAENCPGVLSTQLQHFRQ